MRQPRPTELQLLASLRDGPKPITAGPIGRCVKRGWCRFEITWCHSTATVLYSLTVEGCAVLDVQAGHRNMI